MKLTDEQIVTLRAQSVHWWPFTETDDIQALATEVLESRAEIAAKDAEIERLHSALTDLVSWLPERPTSPVWQLEAGAHGADDAIAAARAELGRDKP
jgi:hypothetical protein